MTIWIKNRQWYHVSCNSRVESWFPLRCDSPIIKVKSKWSIALLLHHLIKEDWLCASLAGKIIYFSVTLFIHLHQGKYKMLLVIYLALIRHLHHSRKHILLGKQFSSLLLIVSISELFIIKVFYKHNVSTSKKMYENSKENQSICNIPLFQSCK